MPIRAFLAIPLPETIQQALARVGRTVPGLRSQRAETIHVTIRFLGEVEDPEPVIAALRPVAAKHAPFDLSLERLGVFPASGPPRVVWVGLGAGEMQAGALAAGVETALLPLGFRREQRPWHGHVTLGRFRDPEPCPPGLVDRTRKFGEARAERLVLYRSALTPDGAVHAEVASLPLGGGSVTTP